MASEVKKVIAAVQAAINLASSGDKLAPFAQDPKGRVVSVRLPTDGLTLDRCPGKGMYRGEKSVRNPLA